MTRFEEGTKMKKRPVGRPVGWRKDDAKRETLMVRLTDGERAWLRKKSLVHDLPESEIVRRIIRYHRQLRVTNPYYFSVLLGSKQIRLDRQTKKG